MFLKFYQLKLQPLLNKFKIYLYNRKLIIQKKKFQKQLDIETHQVIEWFKHDITAVDFWYGLQLHHEKPKTIKQLKYFIENSIYFVDRYCDDLLLLSIEDLTNILQQHDRLGCPNCILTRSKTGKLILFSSSINQQDYDILVAEVVTLLKENLPEDILNEILNSVLDKIYLDSFKLKKLDESIIELYKQKTQIFISNVTGETSDKNVVGELLDEVRKILFIGSKHVIEYYLKEFDLKATEIN